MAPPFLTRVRIKNYRSIATCDVCLGSLVFFVGRNGSGKSNFLEAVRLVTDGLRGSLEQAIRERGGFLEILRRTASPESTLDLQLNFKIPEAENGFFELRLQATPGWTYRVIREECWFGTERYLVENGTVVEATFPIRPPASPDRLYLVPAGGLPQFRPVYEAFENLCLVNPSTEMIRRQPVSDTGEFLKKDASNLGSFLSRLWQETPQKQVRIEEYLGHILPGLQFVTSTPLEIRQNLEYGTVSDLLVTSMSDGTLRAIAVLAALLPPAHFQRRSPLLIGIEEPEVALHPAALGVLRDAIFEASESRQVLVTTHSPDLLDHRSIEEKHLLAVEAREGITHIGRIANGGKEALLEQLYTAGELLRLDQLMPCEEEESQEKRSHPSEKEGH